jgi:hypothetical protein
VLRDRKLSGVFVRFRAPLWAFDGEIIVIHDETLDRTTNGKGAVNQYTIPE